MGLTDSLRHKLGRSKSQKLLKEMDEDIKNLVVEYRSEGFSSEEDMREEAEKLIEGYADTELTREEVAFSTVWALSAYIIKYYRDPYPEDELDYYRAAVHSVLELAEEYQTAGLKAEHRPHVIAYALFYLDTKVSQKASKHRKYWALEYREAEEKGDEEAMENYEQMIEDELQEEMQWFIDQLQGKEDKLGRYIQDK